MDTDVLVVGAGPIGMVAALTLARHGVPCVLADEGFETTSHPKLDFVNSRSGPAGGAPDDDALTGYADVLAWGRYAGSLTRSVSS